MILAGTIVSTREGSPIIVEMTDEASRLIIRALTSVHCDEAIAIDLMKRASRLISAGMPMATQRIAGGLAAWQEKRVRQHIDAHLAETILLQDLAALVKLSTSYFSTAFKVSFGMSPHNYIVARRVEHAKYRMASSNAPLSEIAFDCGLADQAHLSRIFRRATGTTPSAWRRHEALEN